MLAAELASAVLEVAYGESFAASPTSYGPSGQSSRTSPAGRIAGSTLCEASWQSRDMKRFRSRLARVMSERLTAACGSSSSDTIPESGSSEWPTAAASEYKRGLRDRENVKRSEGPTLSKAVGQAVKDYPTPTATAYGSGNNGDPHDGRGSYATAKNPSLHTLARQSKEWPTPTHTDYKASGSRNTATSKAHPGVSLTDAILTGDSHGRRGRETQPGGSDGSPPVVLHSRFVEALMGFPPGFVVPPFEHSETASCPKRPASSEPSSCSSNDE